MNGDRRKLLDKNLERLKAEKKALKEKLVILKKENQTLRKNLNESRKLFEDLPGLIVLIQDSEFVFINKKAQKRSGYTEEELLGRNFLDFIHPDFVEQTREIHQKRLSGEPVLDNNEIYLVTKNGDTVCCEAHVKKIKFRGNTAFLVNMVGLEQRKLMEKESIRTQKLETIHGMASGLIREVNSCLDILKEHAAYILGLN